MRGLFFAVFFAEKPTFWAKSQAFYTFPSPWDTVSLFAPAPPRYSISACSRPAAVQYLCSLPSRRSTVSLFAPVPPWVQYLCLLPSRRGIVSLLAPPTAGYSIPAYAPYRWIQYPCSYPPYQRGTIFPLIPDKGNFYCQSESPCLFSLSRKNFYKKSDLPPLAPLENFTENANFSKP